MSFEQPNNTDFLSEIIRAMEENKAAEWHLAVSVPYPEDDSYDRKLENQHYERLENFLKRIAEQEGVTDKETLITALKKYRKETTDENEKSMTTTLLEEYLEDIEI